MGFWDRIRGAEKADLGTSGAPGSALLALTGGIPVSAGVTVNAETAMKVAAVYACVRVLAEDIAKLPITVWRDLPGGRRQEATDQALYTILKRPNQHMTRHSLMLALGSAYGFRGNALAVILRDGRGRPYGLWPVQPGGTQLLEAYSGELFYSVPRTSTLDLAVLDGKPALIPARDVLHVKGLTFDGLVGLSPLYQLGEPIGIAIAGEKLSGSQMANGAEVGGVLTHPKKLADDVLQRLRASWRRRFSGPGKAGETVILEDGMKYEKLGMTAVDAQFLDQRKLTIEEIARGFRVPLHMIGYLDKAAGNNSQEQATRNYYDQTLMPILEAFESALDRAFALPPDCYTEFDVKRLLRADFKTRQDGNRVMFQSGALSPNEWRIDEGKEPTPGGDVYARPLNTAFVDASGKVVSVTPAGGNDTGASANG